MEGIIGPMVGWVVGLLLLGVVLYGFVKVVLRD